MCLSVKGLGKGIRLESKINQCHVVCMPAAVVSLASPLTIIPKLQWPYTLARARTHTHTRLAHTPTDGCQRVSPISKCLDNAQKETVCQMLSWHNNLHLSASLWSNSLCLIYFLLLSQSPPPPPLQFPSLFIFFFPQLLRCLPTFPFHPLQSTSPNVVQSMASANL